MKKPNQQNKDQIKEPEAEWDVTFEQVEEAQLREMLKATPAQRLAMAEELAQLVTLAHSAKKTKS